jgi:hypothetical protein
MPRYIQTHQSSSTTKLRFLLLCLAAGVAAPAQDVRNSSDETSYIREHTAQVPPLFRPALGSHLHCSVFRQYPKNQLDSEKAAASLGNGYAGLIPLLSKELPAYHVIAAHQCSHDARKFVHVTLQDHTGLVSLIITRKAPGESFANQKMTAPLQTDPLRIQAASSSQHHVAAFQTGEHLAYVVSDRNREENTKLMGKIGPKLQQLLLELEH